MRQSNRNQVLDILVYKLHKLTFNTCTSHWGSSQSGLSAWANQWNQLLWIFVWEIGTSHFFLGIHR